MNSLFTQTLLLWLDYYKGASSLVKHFLQQSNADTSFGRRVAEVLNFDFGFDFD